MKLTNFQRFGLLFALLALPSAFAESSTAAERPNILWLTCEDNNVNWVGCYGNRTRILRISMPWQRKGFSTCTHMPTRLCVLRLVVLGLQESTRFQWALIR